MPRKINLEGQKIGRLTVVTEVDPLIKNGRRYRRYECLCDCGKTAAVMHTNLMRGASISCGCYRSELSSERYKKLGGHNKFEKGYGSFRILFARYKHGAQKRGIEFNLSEDEFRILVTSDCAYCGYPPNQIIKGPRSNGEFIYNGIDREFNDRGYEHWNCVACCKFCNFAKKRATVDEFHEWLFRIKHNTFFG